MVTGVTQHQSAGRTQAAQRARSSNDGVTLERFAGKNRYLTAVAISKAHFPEGTWPPEPNGPDAPAPVESVIVASGSDYPDALAGGTFAAGLGPLLLVPSTGTVPAAVKAEIQRLKPTFVYILGGKGAVSTEIEAQLKPLGTIRRFNGENRYDTAAWLGTATADKLEGTDTVVLASGEDFADALAGGASAANQEAALLLTRNSLLSPETEMALQTINPKKVQVLGGPSVVSDAVLASVKAALPDASIQRIHGAGRADTAAALSRVTFPERAEETFLVNDADYPDALAAAPLAWFWGASVLMTRTACAPAATIAEDTRLKPDYRAAIGGTSVVSDDALRLKPC